MALTKEDLQAIRSMMQEELVPVKEDISALRVEMTTMREELTPIKENISALKVDMSTMQKDVADIKESLAEVWETTNTLGKWADTVANITKIAYPAQ